MPRGEPSYTMSSSGSTYGQPFNNTSSTAYRAPKIGSSRGAALTAQKITDPTRLRAGGRNSANGLFNPALLKGRPKLKSLINQRMDDAMASLVSAYDPLKIG